MDLLQRNVTADLHVRASAEGTDERIIEGRVIPFGITETVADRDGRGVLGKPYKESIVRGATADIDPAKVKLESMEHAGKLVGRGISAEETDEGLNMAFKVAKTAAGDELLELAREGVLTDMSASFEPISERRAPGGVVERTAINIRRVAVLERGAYPAAQITAVRADPDPPPPAAAPVPEDPPTGGSSDSRSTKVSEQKDYTNPEDRLNRIHELEESLNRQATEFTGVMPPEAQVSWDADRAELEKHRADQAAHVARQAYVATQLTRQSTEPEAPQIIVRKDEGDIYDLEMVRRVSRTREEYGLKVRDHALKAVEITRLPDIADQTRAKSRITDLVEFHDSEDGEIANRILATGSPVYKRAFNKYIKSNQRTAEEQYALERAAMAVGVDATGGFAVPFAFDPTFINIGAWTSISPYRSGAVRVETISGTDTWRGVTSTAVTVGYALEAAATTEGAPTLAQPELIVKRAQGFATVSYEIMQDRADLGSELSRLFAEAKDTYEENQFTLGVGTTVFPQGTGLKDVFTRVDTATTVVLVIQDIRNTANALPIRHRFNAVWLLSRAAIQFIQGLETVGGQLFNGVNYPSVGTPQLNPGGNTGLRLLGYPVYETPSMTFTPTVADSTWGVLLNPEAYLVVDRLGLSVEVIANMFDATTGFPTGQRGVLAFWRNTARVINVDGGRQGAIL